MSLDFIETRQVATILEKTGAGIRKGEGPAPLIRLCPRNSRTKIELQVQDWTLTTMIRKLGVVTLIDQVEHDRAGAKVERHARAHVQTGMAIQGQLMDTALFDLVHPNRGSGQGALHDLGIAPQATIRDNRR
jgi:hypothetical protein